jgi:uncharacterized protein
MQWSDQTRELYGRAIRLPDELVSPEVRVLLAAMKRADEYAADVLCAAVAQSLSGAEPSGLAATVTSILLKPVGDSCNLACGYCYEAERVRSQPQRRMTIDDLRAILGNLLPYVGQPFSIFVHGGEPLLRGLEFFQALVDHARRMCGKAIRFGVQTNATLIDQRWAAFFAANEFHVGVSLDGPESINDLQRPSAKGLGSHAEILRGIDQLRSAGAPFGLICMVTKQSASAEDTPSKLYDFFRRSGITDYDIHPALTPTPQSREFNVSPQDYSVFMARLFDTWLEGGDARVAVRTIDHFFQGMKGVPAAACYRSGMCTSIIGVEPNGDVAPCTRPFPTRYTFGNLVRQPLTDIVRGSISLEFAELELLGQRKTDGCEWSSLCGSGGCPHERLDAQGEQSISGRHMYCTCHSSNGSGGYPSMFRYFRSRVGSLLRTAAGADRQREIICV